MERSQNCPIMLRMCFEVQLVFFDWSAPGVSIISKNGFFFIKAQFEV